MSGKKVVTGMGARMASATAVQDVAAGLAAATGVKLPEAPAEKEAPAEAEAPTTVAVAKAEDAALAEIGAPAKATSEPPAVAVVKAEVVAINIRLPKAMHRTLRDIAHRDEISINAILIDAAKDWLDTPKAKAKPE